jgi:hypothetical protein
MSFTIYILVEPICIYRILSCGIPCGKILATPLRPGAHGLHCSHASARGLRCRRFGTPDSGVVDVSLNNACTC